MRFAILSSSVVERSTVNRLVVGSNPTWGVFKLIFVLYNFALLYFAIELYGSCSDGLWHLIFKGSPLSVNLDLVALSFAKSSITGSAILEI